MNNFTRARARIVQAVFAPLLFVAFTSLSVQAFQSDEEDDESYRFTATYQIEKGTRQGKVILRVDMPETWHTYSLTQPNPPGPTEVTVKRSKAFKLTAPFAADREAKITDDDPIFGRLEEHFDEVLFTAPLEVGEAAELERLEMELTLSCQVCSESTCEFIKKRKFAVEFDGYYEPSPPEKKDEPNSAGTPTKRSPVK